MAVAATFGTITLTQTRITVPVTLASEVRYVDASSFTITTTSGSIGAADITISNVFKNTGNNSDKRKYNLFLDLPLNVNGTVSINPNGNITTSTGTRDNLSGTATTYNFDTRDPFIEYYDPPDFLPPTGGYAFVAGFNVAVKELGIDDFYVVGEDPGTPQLYISSYMGAPSGLPTFSTTDATNWTEDSSGSTTTATIYFALYFGGASGANIVTIGTDQVTIGTDPVSVGTTSGGGTVPQQLSIYLKEGSVAVA